MKTISLPPQEIYNVLLEAESKGIKLPKSVEEWWQNETIYHQARAEVQAEYDRGEWGYIPNKTQDDRII